MDLSKAMELFTLNQRVFIAMGVRPFSINDRVFAIVAGYMALQCCLEYAVLIQYINNFEYVVSNLSETWVHTMALFKLGACRFNVNQLRKMLLDIIENYAIEKYEILEEWQASFQYNRIAYKFMKINLLVIFAAAMQYYLRPLTGQLALNKSFSDNSSSYVIPYQTCIFLEITELQTYIMGYVYQMPVSSNVSLCYTGTDYLLITLLFHVRGQLVILSQRIKITMVDFHGYTQGIGLLVTKHVRLIRLARAIDKTYNLLLLLQQILGVTLIICLVGYYVIVMHAIVSCIIFLHNCENVPLMHLFPYLVFISAMLLLLLSNSFIGDCLIIESTSLCNVFYNCEWYHIPPQHAGIILVCMSRTTTPLDLTAGGCYILSLQSFTDVIKVSLTILSVLRKFL